MSLLGAALALLAAAPAPREVPLDPSTTHVLFTVHALGVWPLHGRFSRFHGTVRFTPGVAGQCAVEMAIDLASLRMTDPAMREDVLSPSLLNAAAFPELLYRGVCAADDAVKGAMTLHGVSRPLRLRLHTDTEEWVAEGRFQRAEWGITGRPLLAGPEVEVQITVAVPRPDLPARSPPP
jgi:polyisoprenoid-binding protein YceI